VTDFLNRHQHLEKIRDLLNSDSKSPRLVLTVGREGVGKSALLRRAALAAPHRLYIFCDRNKALSDLPGGLPFLRLIEQQLSLSAREFGFKTIDQFRVDHKWSRTLKKGAKAVASITSKALLPSAVSDLAKEIYQYIKTSHQSAKKQRRLSNDTDDLRLLYIFYVLKSIPTIIHIDHAHILDEEENNILLHLHHLTDQILFLEFTSENKNLNDIISASVFTKTRAIQLYVEPLAEEYADILFSSLPERFSVALRRKFMDSGDLRQFDLAVPYQDRQSDFLEIFEASEETLRVRNEKIIESLSSDHKNILLSIAAHAGPVDKNIILELVIWSKSRINFSSDLKVDSALELLSYDFLIVTTLNDVMCAQKVNELIQSHPTLRVRRLAFQKLWRDFYKSAGEINIFISYEDRCKQILYQCSALDDIVGIAATLEEIGRRGIATRNPKSVISYIKKIVNQISFGASRECALAKVTLAQCRFLYEAGWFDEALECMTLSLPKNRRQQFLLAELYCATKYQERGIRLAESFLKEIKDNKSSDLDAELCLRLIKLHGLRNSNQLMAARDYYIKTVTDRRFHKLAAYPTLLRYADLCLFLDEDYSQCIAYLREAITLSESRGMINDYVSACISLAQQLGYSDDLDQAEGFLDKADSMASQVWIQRPMLLTNRAVLSMYRGIFKEDSLLLLEQALVLSSDSLDRILIQTNIMIWFSSNGRNDKAIDAARALQELVIDTGIDTEIRRIVLLNIEQVFRIVGHEDAANNARKAWVGLSSGIDEKYWSVRKSNAQLSSSYPKRYFITYYPVYLAHWHMGFVPFEAVVDDA
jgi:tetratricopeptide (TPR) repeat protein